MDEDKQGGAPPQEEHTGWRYNPGDSSSPAGYEPALPQDIPVAPQMSGTEWTASEFIAHQKNIMWYMGLTGVTIIVGITTYIVTRDVFTTLLIGVLAIIFGAAASLKPRVLTYQVGPSSLRVGAQVHPYSLFKSFAVVDEGAFSNIILVPFRRFSLPISIYYPPEEEQAIIEALSFHLPMQPPSNDMLDRLMRSIHF